MDRLSSVESAASSIDLSLPPGSFGMPWIGETVAFFTDRTFAQKRHRQYGPIFKTRILGQPTIFVQGPEANQFILTHENEYFRVQWPPSTAALLGGNSLALQQGDIHQGRRKLLAQAFMPRALSSYITTIQDITAVYAQKWAAQGSLAWYPELRNYTFDVAAKLLVGLDNATQTQLGHWFEIWTGGLFSMPVNLPWTRFGRALRVRQLILKEIAVLIRQRQAAPSQSTDALDLLLQAEDENGDRISESELQDQLLLLLFAGHETLTSNLITFCYQTALHPEILQKLREEQQVFVTQPITLDTLKQMTYLEQVLKEVLRITPPVGGVFRTLLKTCAYNKYRLPQGWSVLCSINSTHSDPHYYPQVDDFNPERFSPDAQSKIPKYSYIPFGGGLRECLGKEFARLEMRLFAIHLLRHYHWELLPNQNLTLATIPTPIPQDGLKVNFQRLPQECN